MKTFILTEEQQMVHELAASLAQTELKARSEQVDHEEMYPAEGISFFAEAGLLGCAVPEEIGGTGLGYMSQVMALGEAAKECASTSYEMALACVAMEAIRSGSSCPAAEEWIGELTAGTPAAVADAACAGKVTAKPDGDGYILEGSLACVPNAERADYIVVPAEKEGKECWFLLKKGTEGLSAAAGVRLLGLKGCAFGDLVLRGCRVGAEHLLKSEAGGQIRMAYALYMAAISYGIAQGALAEAINYDNQRVQFKKTIAQFENTQQVTAALLAKAEAARALVWEAASVADAGENAALAAAMAKTFAADVAAETSKKSVQLMGGYGYSREYPVERKMRDAKMAEILGGETAAQNRLIAVERTILAL